MNEPTDNMIRFYTGIVHDLNREMKELIEKIDLLLERSDDSARLSWMIEKEAHICSAGDVYQCTKGSVRTSVASSQWHENARDAIDEVMEIEANKSI